MELMLPGEWLARFFDLRPKVIVASGDPMADAGLHEANDPSFDVWLYTATGAVSGTIRPRSAAAETSERMVAAPNPPAATCVLAAQTTEGCESLEQLRAWWLANGPCPAAPILRCLTEGNPLADILRELLQTTQRELRDMTAQASSATAQIYELRCEYDQTRLAVESLQYHVNRLRQRSQLLTVNLPPNGLVYAPPGGRGCVVQPLPVSAEGLAGIHVHFPARGPLADDTQVLVRLHAVEQGRDLGAWRLLAHHLGKGWVHCWLPEVLAEASHNLELRVEWQRGGANGPAISLASAGDWDELRARPVDPPGVVDGCLALTAWTGGVPGMPLTSRPRWCAADDSGCVEYSLHPEEIARMCLRVPPVAGKPHEWNPFRQHFDGRFTLHPIGEAATTLQLTNGCVPGIDRVTAVVKITSPYACGSVLYGIAAARGDEVNSLMDLPDLAADPRFQAFSGWHLVPRDDNAHVLVMDFPEPLAHPAHLIFATRMPPGVDHAWAWAEWLDVRLRVRGLRVPGALRTPEQTKLKLVA